MITDFSEVAPHLFITNWESSNDPNLLRHHNIRAVVTIEQTPKPTEFINFAKENGIQYMHIFLDDHPSENISEYFDQSFEFIDKHISLGENITVHCLPEDMRVLTNHGFLFLKDIEKLLEKKCKILYACYDKTKKTIIYDEGKLIVLSDEVAQQKRIVNFTECDEKRRWINEDDEYGREELEGDELSNHVSLRVTDDHEMFVSRGNLIKNKNGKTHICWSRRKDINGKRIKVLSKVKAKDLIVPSCNCKDYNDNDNEAEVYCVNCKLNLCSNCDYDLHQGPRTKKHKMNMLPSTTIIQCDECSRRCDHERACAGFVSCAENGIEKPEKELEFIKQLQLDTQEKINGFLELYGFWLGDGFLAVKNKSISFKQRKIQDKEFLRTMLEKCGLKQYEDYQEYTTNDRCGLLNITNNIWWDYFYNEYKTKYVKDDIEDTNEELYNDDDYGKGIKWLWPWVLRDLNKEQLRILINGLRLADGIRKTGKGNAIFTSSVSFRDDIYLCLLHAGYSVFFHNMYTKGTLRGYYKYFKDKGTVIQPMAKINKMQDKDKYLHDITQDGWKPVIANHDNWAVIFTEPTSSSGKMSSLPNLFLQRDVTVSSYDKKRDGRLWCVNVNHPDNLIFAQRAYENKKGIITKASKPTVIGNCWAGISRSVTIALNYLMRKMYEEYGDIDPQNAVNIVLEHVRITRPFVNPNSGFIRQLVNKAKEYQQRIRNFGNRNNNFLNNSEKRDLNSQHNNNNMASPSPPTPVSPRADCDAFVCPDGTPGNVICLSNSDFDQQGNLINFPNVNGVIAFMADFCGHCKNMKPAYAQFSKMVPPNVRVFKVDGVKSKDLMSRITLDGWGYTVRGFPSIVSYNQGKFYSVYAPDKNGKHPFRSAEDLLEYAQGIGSATVEYE